MTAEELRDDVADRMNLTSTTALDRISLHINRRYRRVRMSIGMVDTVRLTDDYAMDANARSQTIAGIEKVISVVDNTLVDANNNVHPRVLAEDTYEEMIQRTPRTDRPEHWAVARVGAEEVTLLFDFDFPDGLTLQIEGEESPSTLDDDQEPDFPESFHDILIFGAIADELRKMEKQALARDAEMDYERVLSELRMHLAVSSYKDVVQGKLTTPARINPFRRVGGTGL